MANDLDQRERYELCDLFIELGPDAPTLNEGWTTSDLVAHLVVRERDIIGAPGILIPRFSHVTDRRMAAELDGHGYAGAVERVRSGPPFGPLRIAALRHAINMMEFFVHHEDVRRANGCGPRTDRPDLQDDLWGLLGRMAPLMVRKAGVKNVRIILVRPDGTERSVGKGGDEVRLTGEPAELVLELYGRRTVAEVAYDGPASAIDRVRAAEFGI